MEQPQSTKDKCAFLADCVGRGRLSTAEALSIACSDSSGGSQGQGNQRYKSPTLPQMNATSAYKGKSEKRIQPPGELQSHVKFGKERNQ